jgi:aminopeptidase
MPDNRIKRLARVLVGHSVKARKGDTVLITASSELAKPLCLEVFREVVDRGAHPLLNVGLEETQNIFYSNATHAQIRHLPKIKLFEARNIDCVISIRATHNKKSLSGIDPRLISERTKALRPISEEIVNRKRWVITNFPTHSLAENAEMGLEEYEDFLYKATNIDWARVRKKEEGLKKALDMATEVKITGKDTLLSIGIKGRKAIACYGERNMPDGEVFLSPVEDSAEGHIYYDMPAIYMGNEVIGARLKFKGGRVVDAGAEKNEAFLIAMLETDKGAKYLGELGIGFNYGIKRFSKDILFDEKIGGTVHLALGRSYEDAGGKNISAIHWDMIKDLRQGGEIRLDGKPIQRNGRFLI